MVYFLLLAVVKKNIMNKFLLVIALSFFTMSGLKAQYLWDFGGGIGSSNYLGDIGGQGAAKAFVSDIQLEMSRPSFNLFARYKINNLFGASAGFAYGWIQGADNLSNDPSRFSRNLSFRNHLFEISGRGEVYLLRLNDVGRSGRYRLDFSTYLFAGAAGLYHNPKTEYEDEWIALQPLQTEGVQYSKIQLAIPAGLGVYFTLFRHHRFGFEIGTRFTTTDYLDDVSTFYKQPSLFEDPLAAILADRSNEVDPNDPKFVGSQYFSEGTEMNPELPSIRGGAANPDYYLMAFATYSYVLRGKKSNFTKPRYNFITGHVKKRKSKAKF